MERTQLNVRFTDEVYGAGCDGPIMRALRRYYDVSESESPDVVFFGEGKSREFRRFRSVIRIYVAVENRYPNFSECDYALTFLYLNNSRHLRVPVYVFDSDVESLLSKHQRHEELLLESRKFCSFVVSNGSRRTERRLRFFKKLNEARKVSSGGRILNNVGGAVANKHQFIREHRFDLCFENHIWPGYTTEKLAHSLGAGCIPIYWGNPIVAADFNPASFINVSDFANDDEAVAHILRVADNVDLQRSYLQAPSFSGNHANPFYCVDRLAVFLRKAIERGTGERPFISIPSLVFRVRRQFGLY